MEKIKVQASHALITIQITFTIMIHELGFHYDNAL